MRRSQLNQALSPPGNTFTHARVPCLKPCDLRVAAVGDAPGRAESCPALFTLVFQVGERAVEGASRDPGLRRERLDVTSSARTQVASQQAFHGGADVVFDVLGPLGHQHPVDNPMNLIHHPRRHPRPL